MTLRAMTVVGDIPAGAPADVARADVAGRDRIVWNVLASWVGHVVFIAAGFAMPRLIDRHLGQVSLGIWDFGWSIVSYFVLAQVGVGSSVNRYVAKFRATADVAALQRTVSSVNVIQMGATALALACTAALTWLIPRLLGDRLGVDVVTARWTIALLGSSMAVQLAFNVFGGVLTGCHRWDIHNGVTAGAYAVIVAGMIAALKLGGGLPTLAAVYLAGTLCGELVRMAVSYRTCPELRVDPRLATRADVRMLLTFGGKTIIDNLARLLLQQANAILVVSYLGPGALAVYARPSALVRHVDTLTNKFGMLLSPAASSLQTTRRADELQDLFVRSTRFAASIAIPVAAFLTIMGEAILHVWMGPGYRAGTLMAIIAIGSALPVTQRPSQHILIGLNAHGRIGFASFGVAVAGVIGAIAALGPLRGGIEAAALSLVVPYSLGNGVFVMVYACRRLGIPLRHYLRRAFFVPVAATVPMAAALATVHARLSHRPALALAIGGAVAAAILAPVYWRFVLPAAMRERIVVKLSRRRAAPLHLRTVDRTPSVATAAELRPTPFPYRAAVAVCSDLDETPDRHVYLESMRFLNTTDETAMGPGVGLEIGNTIYFDMERGQFAYWNTDDRGRDIVRTLIRSGHVDCLHSYGDLATTRAHAARALEELERHGCRLEVWVDHAVAPTNFGADIMRGEGDVPGSPAYHADLTCAHGVRFVWRGRVTSVIGQNTPRRLRGTFDRHAPLRSTRTLLKEAAKGARAHRGDAKYAMHAGNQLLRLVSLRDGQSVYEFLRSNPHPGGVSCGDTADGIASVLGPRVLDRLVERDALTVIYTHLGKIASPREPFGIETRRAFQRLARMRDERLVLVTTTRRLLGYAAALRELQGWLVAEAGGGVRVELRRRTASLRLSPSDLQGLTVYVPAADHVRLFVDGDEIRPLQRNPADHTGRPSVTIPWKPLQFPPRCP